MTIPQGMCVGAREGGCLRLEEPQRIFLLEGGRRNRGLEKNSQRDSQGPVRAREEGHPGR